MKSINLLIPVLVIYFITFVQINAQDGGMGIRLIEKSDDIQSDDIQPEVVEEEVIFYVVEDRPQFPGGDDSLMSYLLNNVEYPQTASDDKVSGTVIVTFVVDKNGDVKNAKILRGVREDLDEAAINVVENMPKWSPGKQRGKAVNVQVNLPITFRVK